MVGFHLCKFKMLFANRAFTKLTLVRLDFLVVRKRTDGKVTFVTCQYVRINSFLVGYIVTLDEPGVAGAASEHPQWG